MNALEFTSISKTYRGSHARPTLLALDDISLEVPEATIFGVLGPNGAGKTTLIKIALGLVRASAGTAVVLRSPVQDQGIRARIGFLQEGQTYPEHLTALQYVVFMGRLSGLTAVEATRRANNWLEHVGLKESRDRRIGGFSKGMYQRLGIAAALLHDPSLVFLDEPTDGVDPIGRRQIKDLIHTLKSEGRTVVLNTHILAEASQLCDHIAILNFGRIVVKGALEEIRLGAFSGAVDRQHVRYLIQTTGDDLRPFLPRAPGLVDKVDADGTTAELMIPVTAGGASDLVDFLRGVEVRIRAIQPLETTLEDRFIDLIHQDNIRRFSSVS